MRIKPLLNTFTFVFLSFILTAHLPLQEDKLTVTITGLRNNNGHVLLSLFREGSGFPDEAEKAFRKIKSPISNNTVVINFTGLPAGNYAIAIMHDENDDGKLNKNWLGLPKEGYGFSNNVMGTFGPPGYHNAKFTYTAGKATAIEIKTKY